MSRMQVQGLGHDRTRQARCRLWGIALLFSVWSCAVGAGVASDRDIVLFSEDFEAGLTERWVEQGFPSIARRNVFSLAVERDGNRYLRVVSTQYYSAKGVHLTLRSWGRASWTQKLSR